MHPCLPGAFDEVRQSLRPSFCPSLAVHFMLLAWQEGVISLCCRQTGGIAISDAMVLHRKLGVSAPIMDGIYRVIHEGADARDIVSEVMCRPLTAEVDASILQAAARPA